MKIYLADNAILGHHRIYENALLKIDNTIAMNIREEFISPKENVLKAYIQRLKFFKKIEREATGEVVHLLYMDSLYNCPFIDFAISNKIKGYIATLHWVPNDKVKIYLLKRFCKKMKCIVVHSGYLKNKLINMGINNVKYIDYPSFINKDKINEAVKDKSIKDKPIIISCLGGTRYDKGVDILVESFKYIKDDFKNKILFNISGKELAIKYDYIENEAKKNNINIILKKGAMSDEEYENEVINSDVILLPYRKVFAGNSGPMTDGIYANKFILCPDYGNLGFLNKKYNLGATFKVEDSKDLAEKISELVNCDLNVDHKYRELLDVNIFMKKHEEIYKEIYKEIY